MKTFIVLMLVAVAQAQTITIAGGPNDANFIGGARWNSVNQASMLTLPANYQTLRYSSPVGSRFSYTFAVPPGTYTVRTGFVEPNKTGMGQRVFSVAFNGIQNIADLDLWAVAGAMTPYVMETVVPAPDATITLEFRPKTASMNAIVSFISIVPIATTGTQFALNCEKGVVNATDATQDSPNQEFEVMSNIPGTRRWEHLMVCVTQRFAGREGMTMSASMGRPGANDSELFGANIDLTDLYNNNKCWMDRPVPPSIQGPYSVVLNLSVTPGSVNQLSGGQIAWESCHFDGLIGVAPTPVAGVMGPAKLNAISVCSGSGGTLAAKDAWNCGGLLNIIARRSDGTRLSVLGVPGDIQVNPLVHWTQLH